MKSSPPTQPNDITTTNPIQWHHHHQPNPMTSSPHQPSDIIITNPTHRHHRYQHNTTTSAIPTQLNDINPTQSLSHHRHFDFEDGFRVNLIILIQRYRLHFVFKLDSSDRLYDIFSFVFYWQELCSNTHVLFDTSLYITYIVQSQGGCRASHTTLR